MIKWWGKALRGGTLYDLSRYWESGDSILGAIKSGRGFNVVAVATVIASAIVLDGPLLQQASTIVSKPIVTTVNVTAPIAQEMPYGYTGGWFGDVPLSTSQRFIMNTTFAQIVNSYITRDKTPLTNAETGFEGCSGECYGTIKAAGLATNCSSVEVPWDNNSTSPNFFNSSTVFSSGFTWIPGNPYVNGSEAPSIQFDLSYVKGRAVKNIMVDGPGQSGEEDLCNGTMVMRNCSMQSATLEYPISLINGTISLLGNSSSYQVDRIQPYGIMPRDPLTAETWEDFKPMSWSTLGGIVNAAQNMFVSDAQEDLYFLRLNGSMATQYADYGPEGRDYITTQQGCAMNWRDPTDDIMNTLNEIMFRTSLVAKNYPKYILLNESTDPSKIEVSYYEAWPVTPPSGDKGIPVPQVIAMEQHSNINVFQSHYSYLAGALAVMVLGVLFVIPTFNGFWHFGRSVSLNPLEIAKAFNPDILEEIGSNASSKHLDKVAGGKEIKYGEVVGEGLSPIEYGREQETLRLRGRKLGLADPSRVRAPEFRALYD